MAQLPLAYEIRAGWSDIPFLRLTMAVLRSDIEKALDELISNEGGMSFQGLAVALGKLRWAELVASERHNDDGLDAYASATACPDKIGKGLASSTTPTVWKIASDAKKVAKNFSDVKLLIFATPAKVHNPTKAEWVTKIRDDFGLDLVVISREDVINSLMLPANAQLCRNFLGLDIPLEPDVAETVDRIKAAAEEVATNWAKDTKGPLIALSAVRLNVSGAEVVETFALKDVQVALRQGQRVVLEAPAGRGKTTTLIQLAEGQSTGECLLLLDLPEWVRSPYGILEFIAGMPQFQARGLDAAALAKARTSAHFTFLLNGWNEVGESNSVQAGQVLQDLDRNFPTAGIIVATRTHHIVPPLPGALRLRLLALTRQQRNTYCKGRLGGKATELITRLDAEADLDQITRTPLVLAEVASLFDAGAAIPRTKIGVLAAVIQVLEQSPEHANPLQASPLFGLQGDYLGVLATEMTRQGAVSLVQTKARALVTRVAAALADAGQIGAPPAPAEILATLCAHHVLERVDYPEVAFRFGHQQFQERYAAVGLRAQLLSLLDVDPETRRRFTAEYINNPVWEEPLRMIAQALAADGSAKSIKAGRLLVEMALDVDPIFAAELARLCGPAVWNEVGTAVSDRLRAWYASRDPNHRDCALAAMLASGSTDFSDVIVPLVSGQDEQTRLRTYRHWPEFHLSSLGTDWHERVKGWSEAARRDFVSDVLHHRFVPEITPFAVEDGSVEVKRAAVDALTWTGATDEAVRVLDSMNEASFEAVAVKMDPEFVPEGLRPKFLAALRKRHDTENDPVERLRSLLTLDELGEGGIVAQVKQALIELPGNDLDRLGHHFVRPALDIVHLEEPDWVSEWIAERVADGRLWPDHWKTLITTIPADLWEKLLQRLETEDLHGKHFGGPIAVLSACADQAMAVRIVAKLRDLRGKIMASPTERHDIEYQIERQLEALFHALSINVAVSGLLASIAGDPDPTDVAVTIRLMSRTARTDLESVSGLEERLRKSLRDYLKKAMPVVLNQDDFNGAEKADLASAIAQVGESEDLPDLMTLALADIERVRKGQAARAAGDRGPLGNGASTSYAPWHLRAMIHLDAEKDDLVLLELLTEPEYLLSVTEELVLLAVAPKRDGSFANDFKYDAIWQAREGKDNKPQNEEQRRRYAFAIREVMEKLFKDREAASETGPMDHRLKELAKALAALDGAQSVDLILHVMALPSNWDAWRRAETAERLLGSGVILPTDKTLALVTDTVGRMLKHGLQDQDRWLAVRVLSLCLFVDDPATGIGTVRELLAKIHLSPYELRGLVVALGQSRRDEVVAFLRDIAADGKSIEHFADEWINAVAALDTAAARKLLLSFVDPDLQGLPEDTKIGRFDILASRIVDLARRDAGTEKRMYDLCEIELTAAKRRLLSKIIHGMGTEAALSGALNLIDDNADPPVPDDTRQHLESAFVERRPYGQSQNTYTLSGRAANDTRQKLFVMAMTDERRKKSAYALLGQIEIWRLEHGRPTGEPRHPAFDSGEPWPPTEPLA